MKIAISLIACRNEEKLGACYQNFVCILDFPANSSVEDERVKAQGLQLMKEKFPLKDSWRWMSIAVADEEGNLITATPSI